MGTLRRFSSNSDVMSVLPSEAYTLVTWGACGTCSVDGKLSKLSAPALAASPVSATAGNAAAATTTPASSPQITSETPLAKTLRSPLRIRITGPG